MTKAIKKTKKVKKTESPTTLPFEPRQYSVFYSIGNEQEFFIAHGTDYKLTTLDIKSPKTSDTFSFPVIFVVDDIIDTLDIIPMNAVGNLRYNWGFKAEAAKYMTEFEAMKKKMEENGSLESVSIDGTEPPKIMPKVSTHKHDVQYG
jgi:hypothetical protein